METASPEYHQLLQSFISHELLGDSRSVDLDDQLLMDGYVDSVGVMRLVAFIEDSLGIKVPPQDFTIENFGTINALAAYLRNQSTNP